MSLLLQCFDIINYSDIVDFLLTGVLDHFLVSMQPNNVRLFQAWLP